MRRVVVAAALASQLCAGCGGPAPIAARPVLGVQSNAAPLEPVLLRVRPAVGARFRTETLVEGQAVFLEQPIALGYRHSQLRVTTDRRPDGTTVFSGQSLGGGTSIRMGDGPARDEPIPTDRAPRVFVMDDRGATVEDGLFAPTPLPAGQRDRLVSLLDPVLDALTYPDHALTPGQSWGARGARAIGELIPEASGEVRFELTQQLLRVEGTSDQALAVIAVRGEVRGEGTRDGEPMSGSLRFDGAYTVAVADGLVRGMEVRVEGQLAMGPEHAALRVPLEATLRYRAEPAP